MRIVVMPRVEAIWQACCPPAPPNAERMWREVSYPFAWVKLRTIKPKQLSVNDDQESVKAKGREGLLGRLTKKHKGKAPTIS